MRKLLSCNMLDLLACPRCKASVYEEGGSLRCTRCGRRYAIVEGVPVMVEHASARIDATLPVRDSYGSWHRHVVDTLLDGPFVLLDIGSGHLSLDRPNLIRMDVGLGAHVDVVGDAHAIPFLDGTIDFVYSEAVLEHLRDPFVAADEMYRVCRPGGYLYADTNFVFPYHGYPHHYFNFSLQGVEQVFRRFRRIRSGVATYQMPSFAVEALLREYLQRFRPETREEMQLADDIRRVLAHPLRKYDEGFSPSAAAEVAAGVFYYGVKQSREESILPEALLLEYARNVRLRERFLDPYDLSARDNLVTWWKARDSSGGIQSCLALPFEKRPLPRVGQRGGGSLVAKSWQVLRRGGPGRLLSEVAQYLRWRAGSGQR